MSKTTRSNKEIQKIINTLKKLPLSQLKVLTFLSFRGPSWPKQINDEIGIPDGTIRPALRQLRSKGYVTQALNGMYRSNIRFTDIIISELIHTHEEFESSLIASVSKIIQANKKFESSVSISVSKIINKREEKFESRLLKSVLKVIHTHEEEFESHVLESVSKIIHTYDEEFESRVLSSVFIHTHEEESESQVSAPILKIIHMYEEKSESRVPAPDPIIISVPEKFRIAIKNLKDAGYPPREIKRIMKAKGKNVPANALRELLKDPIFPGDFSTSRRL